MKSHTLKTQSKLALLSTWDAGAYSFVFQRVAEPVCIIAAIPEQPVNSGQAAEQSPRADVVADLTGGDDQAERTSPAVADGMQLCVHATLGAANQAATSPFFAARLDAVRWALR